MLPITIPFLLVLQSLWVLVIVCSQNEEEGIGIGSGDIGSEEEISKGLGTTQGSYELGNRCDKVKTVLIMEECGGGLGAYKRKVRMSEESLRSPTTALS